MYNIEKFSSVNKIRKYVDEHSNSLASVWDTMLFNDDLFGENYSTDEYIQQAIRMLGEDFDYYVDGDG